FMLVVIFLPGGVMEGVTLVNKYIRKKLGLSDIEPSESSIVQNPTSKNTVDTIAQHVPGQPTNSQKEEGK
ncbi:MAG: hypothetical protein ACI81A_001320, partial [Paraglaciecola sp.]